ncbi:hypothetical protein JYU34_000132 [Plutella xylostella]|uniref:protein-tyrosine-phosphatase n=1 Tax=Plutella xylostella TaxID=51655 RepID=A0ABQ7R6Z4_PLUXY|nr:hypothetical protein JYU34_000132 [Plutella xylostella]
MSNGDDETTNHIEKEYIRVANKNGWPGMYQKVCRECSQYPYTFNEARRLRNKPLNRYRDVNPYDHSRIILKRYDLDYINANIVRLSGHPDAQADSIMTLFMPEFVVEMYETSLQQSL